MSALHPSLEALTAASPNTLLIFLAIAVVALAMFAIHVVHSTTQRK